MEHVWQWILNFLGVNFGQNAFATHMYNFWSGFGSDITEFAIIGTLITIYRHHIKNTNIIKYVRDKEEVHHEHKNKDKHVE